MTRQALPKARFTAGAALLFSVAMHSLLLLCAAQYKTATFIQLPNPVKPTVQAPVVMVFLTEPAASAQATLLPVPSRELRTSPQSVKQVAHELTDIANLAAPIVATSQVIANATEQSRTDRPAVPVGAPSAPRQPDPQATPTQVARPDYAYNPQPDYPMLLREQGVGGVVWLRVWVDSEGQPAEIKLSKGSGYRLLDDAALRAVKLWRFIPAKHGEQRLASWVEFPIRFKLNG
jgi:periplasmic protein TonB